MNRGLTGRYEPSVAHGMACQGFVPHDLPPQPPLEWSAALQEKLDQAHLALGRLDSLTTLLPDAAMFLYSYVRKEAVLSSQIEGTQSSLADLLMFEEDAAPGVPVDDAAEVSCYVAALDHGIALLQQGLPLSSRLICELHERLMQSGRGVSKAPGQYRRIQNWVGGPSPNAASLVPAPPQLIAGCISALENFLNDTPTRHPPLVKAALSHVQFETIHPFLDGNGRVGRLLIPLVLLNEKVLQQPLLYLSLYFKVHRARYYELLTRVRTHGDWEAWLDFFLDAVHLCAAQAVATARQINQLVNADRLRVAALGRSATAGLVFEALAKRPVRSVASICAVTGQSPVTVNTTLLRLQAMGLVREMTGKRRGRVFGYQAYLDALNRDALFDQPSTATTPAQA